MQSSSQTNFMDLSLCRAWYVISSASLCFIELNVDMVASYGGLISTLSQMLVVSLVISAYEKSNKEPESSNSAKIAPDVEAPKSRVQGLWKQVALGSGESSEEVHPSVKAGIDAAIKQAIREERVHQQEVQNLRDKVDRPLQQLLIVDVP